MRKEKHSERGVFRRRGFSKVFGLCCGVAFLVSWSAGIPLSFAAESYPSKKITWICPHAAGGGEDMIVRGIVPYIEKHLKAVSPRPGNVAVIIKNVAGGGTLRGIDLIYSARPDGYTIGSGSDVIFTGEALGEKMGFNVLELTFLARIASGMKVLVAGKRSNLNTWDDVLKESKKGPLRLSIGVFASSNHVAAILFVDTVRLPAQMIIAGTTVGSTAVLIRGDLPLSMHSWDSVKHLIEAKELTPILTFSERIKYPGVQNVKEIGFPELNEVLNSQRTIIAPPKLPANIRGILQDAIRKATQDKEFLAWNEKAGLSYAPIIGPEFEELAKRVITFYRTKEKVLQKYLSQKAE